MHVQSPVIFSYEVCLICCYTSIKGKKVNIKLHWSSSVFCCLDYKLAAAPANCKSQNRQMAYESLRILIIGTVIWFGSGIERVITRYYAWMYTVGKERKCAQCEFTTDDQSPWDMNEVSLRKALEQTSLKPRSTKYTVTLMQSIQKLNGERQLLQATKFHTRICRQIKEWIMKFDEEQERIHCTPDKTTWKRKEFHKYIEQDENVKKRSQKPTKSPAIWDSMIQANNRNDADSLQQQNVHWVILKREFMLCYVFLWWELWQCESMAEVLEKQ